MPKKPSRKYLVKKLDTLFSLYIRLKSADKNGIVKCYRHYITRWKETNAKPQCYSCNCGDQGRQYQFALNLNKEYGYDIAQELLQESKKAVKLSNDDLISLINRYKEFVDLMDK